MYNDATTTHWLPTPESAGEIDCLCLGTGRFLRSVLVPACHAAGYRTALIQARGRSFVKFMYEQSHTKSGSLATYPVDTALYDGTIQTDEVPCHGAFSLGREEDKIALAEVLPTMKPIHIIGLGVTEAGLSSPHTTVMKDLYELLHLMCTLYRDNIWPSLDGNKICIIDMDNVPNNGDTLRKHMLTLLEEHAQDDDYETIKTFLTERIVYFNTMVDRITAHRLEPTSEPLIPRCEPTPAKALVILDPDNDLPSRLVESPSLSEKFGVVVRKTRADFQNDIEWKLRIANGTHTAIAHAMALCKFPKTDALSKPNDPAAPTLCSYLDSLFENQILIACSGNEPSMRGPVQAVYDDWRGRLLHPHFGLSTYFITQNGPAKGGIRLGPTVLDLVNQSDQNITVAMAFAFAALLRWLTPCCADKHATESGIYTGWLDGADRGTVSKNSEKALPENYADGLSYNLEDGWYEFRCSCLVKNNSTNDELNLSSWLATLSNASHSDASKQPHVFEDVILAYLVSSAGGNLAQILQNNSTNSLVKLAKAISTLYARMLAGDPILSLLTEMNDKQGPYAEGFQTSIDALVDGPESNSESKPLHFKPTAIPDSSTLVKSVVNVDSIRYVVASEVQSALAIDLHTHILPPSHGALCLWGIDELLTYHYLVAEYFMTAPASIYPDQFYDLSKQDQADLIWRALFLDRSPVSEATRGVISVLMALGLSDAVRKRSLPLIREFYRGYRSGGQAGAEDFCNAIFKKSGIGYAIMTNIPFDATEAKYWKPRPAAYSQHFRSALRVDPLLTGDRVTIEAALKLSGYEPTLEGARQYLREWCDVMKPEYMMASTPHDFVLQEGTLANVNTKLGVNADALQEPFAFADITNSKLGCAANCDGGEDDVPSVIDEDSDFLSEVLMKVCEERDLPVALKIGAHRGVNPELKSAGDGVVAFADAGMLGRLCGRFPKVRFLATLLSRNNQHEACVLATKFRNLHIYGCWWFCNNPSIIQEITRMRIEMLGTAFTTQHSDARVIDQLLYKWPHTRAILAQTLGNEYEKLLQSGWSMTRQELRRDISRLLGGSYEEFMAKSLKNVD